MREGEYRNGKKHGEWKLYHPTGALKSEATFHEGLYTGYYCSYHDNGEKFREGHYADIQGNSRDGRKQGEWFQYGRDGTTRQKVIYDRGKIVERIKYDDPDEEADS